MEIRNDIKLTQQFINENIKKISHIEVDYNEICIFFNNGEEISFYADVCDLILKIKS